jgi:hypothetical protein
MQGDCPSFSAAAVGITQAFVQRIDKLEMVGQWR